MKLYEIDVFEVLEIQPPKSKYNDFYHWLKFKVKSIYIAELEVNHDRVINLINKFE